MKVDDLRELIRITPSRDFCIEYLFDHSMWYFDENTSELVSGVDYAAFREYVASKVKIPIQDVALGGSAKFGLSLNPDTRQSKLFRPFNDTSDLDLVIVSKELFESVWKALLDAFYSQYYWVMNHHSKHIFRGFVFLHEGMDYKTRHLSQIQKLLNSISADMVLEIGISRILKYRVYRSWDDVIAYHDAGIAQIQRVLEDEA